MNILRKVLTVISGIFFCVVCAYTAMGLLLLQMLATNYGYVVGALATFMTFMCLVTFTKTMLTE